MSYRFEERVGELGIGLSGEQVRRFGRYYELLVEWNRVMNLTAITGMEEVFEKHFVDSLAVVRAVEMGKVETVIDVGTGAGFPGVPLKIVFPHLKVTLLDSLNKRIRFLGTVVDELGLDGVELIHGRAEDFARRVEYREKYDLCVSRAVANLATLSEYCLPFVRVNGKFVSYKSSDVDDEVRSSEKAIRLLGGDVGNVVKFCLPGSDIARSFVCVDKVKQTGKKYPRKAGVPAKEPLS